MYQQPPNDQQSLIKNVPQDSRLLIRNLLSNTFLQYPFFQSNLHPACLQHKIKACINHTKDNPKLTQSSHNVQMYLKHGASLYSSMQRPET